MRLRTQIDVGNKNKLSATLKSWLPILQTNIEELEEVLSEYSKNNPFVELKSGFCSNMSETIMKKDSSQKLSTPKSTKTNAIESLNFVKKGLYESLSEQICPPLFPTKISQNIAFEIVELISDEGYFEGDIEQIAKKFDVTSEMVKKIRERFAYIEPAGVGAINLRESFLFQLNHIECEDEVYKVVKLIVDDFDNITNYKNEKYYHEALNIIKKFKNPPAIDFFEDDLEVIPDIFVSEIDGVIEVSLNEKYYPTIKIDLNGLQAEHPFIKKKIKEAKDLVDALDMRKATLYKIGLMIVEYQYEFFTGGEIKPMRLIDLADEFGHNPSTISRAISNKYLECNRGIIPIKNFFCIAIDDKDVSNTAIKDFIKKIVSEENKNRPLSDVKMLDMIEEKFSIKLVRRTITKYRKLLNIASSNERKKLYAMV
ncbi:MAG: RNA polymerase factor sigma-54 [Campylobacterales bacterium]|nr:RNA polymerase factor sigma-54 [Campylobacterales bacterium]